MNGPSALANLATRAAQDRDNFARLWSRSSLAHSGGTVRREPARGWLRPLLALVVVLLPGAGCLPCKRSCEGDVCTSSGNCSELSFPTTPATPPDAQADAPDAQADANPDGGDASADDVRPAPGCATDFRPPPDPRCGPLPALYAHGCGCTDGVPVAVCKDGGWTCAGMLTPRVRCSFCSGPPP